MRTIRLSENQLKRIFKPFVLETKWNGNGEEWIGLIKPKEIPSKLYHVSNKSYRNSILKYGILASIGDEYEDWWNYEGPNGEEPDMDELPECVFLTSKPQSWYDNLDDQSNYDIWEIDVNNLDKKLIYLDPDRSMASKGSFIYTSDIQINAIRLLK